ncbi:hypothetical protein [Clostridium cadaveris]|uniref:hypothetical protein n=1 Tax=Clostridium cadaveris TaxID=1529 RepID=UPI000C06B58E|nr:hypothetical protein [Clostridium cadaveris]
MANRKQFSNLEEVRQLGILLRVSDIVMQESSVLINNSLNNTDVLVKRINKITEQISQLRSDIDDSLVKIIEKNLYRTLTNTELNELIYPNLDEEQCIKALLKLSR